MTTVPLGDEKDPSTSARASPASLFESAIVSKANFDGTKLCLAYVPCLLESVHRSRFFRLFRAVQTYWFLLITSIERCFFFSFDTTLFSDGTSERDVATNAYTLRGRSLPIRFESSGKRSFAIIFEKENFLPKRDIYNILVYLFRSTDT